MITRLEELSMNAWPPLQTLLLDGWVLRLANGYTRRANSVTPLYSSALDVKEKIAACEEVYRAKKLRVVFKMTRAAQPADLDEILNQRGYTAEALTSVQVAELHRIVKPSNQDVTLTDALSDEWINHYCRLNAVDERHVPTMFQMLNNLVPKHCFISLYQNHRVIACGLAVLQDGFIGLFDLVTDAAFRNRGFGKQLVLCLLDWGKQEDAQRAYLQVMLDNAPAMHLYSKLGFNEVYQYWYRVKA